MTGIALNKEFIITFQPNEPANYDNKRRFSVGALSLKKYIGDKNANQAIIRALNSLEDKCTIRLRKYGRIDFYRK